MQQPTKTNLKDRFEAASLGIEMGASVAVGYGLGWWFDGMLETGPAFTYVFLFCGFMAGFRGVWRVVGKARREMLAASPAAEPAPMLPSTVRPSRRWES